MHKLITDNKNAIIALGIALALFGLVLPSAMNNIGNAGFTSLKNVLNGVSATTTSEAIDIDGAKKVTLSMTVSNLAASGVATSTFVVSVSVDGTNYVTFNKLVDNVANTNSQTLTRVASKAIDSNTTNIVSLDLENDTFKFLKVTDTIIGTTTSVVYVRAMTDN